MSLKLHSFILILFLFGNFAFGQVNRDSIMEIVDGKNGIDKVEYLRVISDKYLAVSNLEEAYFFVQVGINITRKGNLQDKKGVFVNLMGRIAQGKGDFDKALSYYLKAMGIWEDQGKHHNVAIAKTNIAELYRLKRNYKKSLEYFHQALVIMEQLNEKAAVAEGQMNLGAVYYDMGKIKTARDNFIKAQGYYKFINDLKTVAIIINNIGSINLELENNSEAIENYIESRDIFLKLGDTLNYAMSLANIGNVYNENGEYKKGVDFTRQALVLIGNRKNYNLVSNCYIYLAEGYQGLGDYKNAFASQKRLLGLKDTMFDDATNANFAEMQTRFDTEKKEKQNKILKQQNDLEKLNNQRQRIITYSIAAGLCLVLVLAFYIYRGLRQKKKANLLLERKQVEIVRKNKELVDANQIIEEKNKDITDSIQYAKRLQSAILKPEEDLKDYFEDSFIFFRPKDIVSGDFYWFEKSGNKKFLAAVDCTGHGVPGAFMSILGSSLLSQAVVEYNIIQPNLILNSANVGLSKALQQKSVENTLRDGMDLALCSFDSEKMILEYAGANNSLILLRDGSITEYPANKFPVGAYLDNEIQAFSNNVIEVKHSDFIYLFSDGYADQFGGPDGKKFRLKQLKQLMLQIYLKPVIEQKQIFEKTILGWMGKQEQIDDILIIGIRI